MPARAYWLALWLDWARDVTAYVELPADPDSPKEWVADFWVEYGGKDYLLDVPAEARADSAASTTPWSLFADGYEAVDESRGRVTPRWMWARRSLLLSLEQAHPYATSARLQGGLKVTCNQLLSGWPEDGASIGDICRRPGANVYILQCALFHLVRIHELQLDWGRGLSLDATLRKIKHAPEG